MLLKWRTSKVEGQIESEWSWLKKGKMRSMVHNSAKFGMRNISPNSSKLCFHSSFDTWCRPGRCRDWSQNYQTCYLNLCFCSPPFDLEDLWMDDKDRIQVMKAMYKKYSLESFMLFRSPPPSRPCAALHLHNFASWLPSNYFWYMFVEFLNFYGNNGINQYGAHYA